MNIYMWILACESGYNKEFILPPDEMYFVAVADTLEGARTKIENELWKTDLEYYVKIHMTEELLDEPDYIRNVDEVLTHYEICE